MTAFCPNCRCRSCVAVVERRKATEDKINDARTLQSAARLLFLNGVSKARAAEMLDVSPQRLHSAYASLGDRSVVPPNVPIGSLEPHEQRLYRAGALPIDRWRGNGDWIAAPLPPDTWPVTKRRRR